MSDFSYPANAGGGVLLTPGGVQVAATGVRPVEVFVSDEPVLDLAYCQTISEKTEDQCGARPVKEGPHAGRLCVGHIKRYEAAQRAEGE